MGFEPSLNQNCPYKHKHEQLKPLKMLPQNYLRGDTDGVHFQGEWGLRAKMRCYRRQGGII